MNNAAEELRRASPALLDMAERGDTVRGKFMLMGCYGGEVAQPSEQYIATFDSAATEHLYPRAAAARSPVAATVIGDLRVPPSNRLEALKGDRRGTCSIRVNRQYRITFQFSDGDAYGVRCEDYHR